MENIKSRIEKINHKIIKSYLRGDIKRQRFYQSLLTWIVSQEIKTYNDTQGIY
jgi:hypothetical protein